MKVLFYSHTAKISGAEMILLLLIEKLDRSKFKPSAICSGEGPLPEKLREMDVPCETTGELTARFTVNPFRLFGYIKSVVMTAISLRQKVRKLQPDLIHANSIRAGIVAAAATTGSKIPVYWHLQDDIGTHPISTLIRIYTASSRRIRLLAASGQTLESFQGKLLKIIGRKTPSSVIHNVVDSKRFEDDPETRKRLRDEFDVADEVFLIGTIGQITPRKGQLELIEAFAKCLKEGLTAKLLIIGTPIFNSDHEYLEDLKHKAESLGISESVEFLGFRKDIPGLLSALDTVVINSRSEAFVVVGVEGLAAGVPVVATDVGGIREMLTDGENGIVVSFGDEKALTAAILRLANEPALRRKFAERGRAVVKERLNADVFIRNVELFFENENRVGGSNRINQMSGVESNA